MKYLIWSFDYTHASAGAKSLHRLCHELNEAGQEAYIGSGWIANPEWNTPSHAAPLGGDWCAVYPEIVHGNPWNAPRVARWVLNVPGLLGGDKLYDPAEYVFSWSPIFLEGVPYLYLPSVEMDIYTDRGEPRDGMLYWVGKGLQGDTVGAQPVTLAMREDRYTLADALNRATMLRSFDAVSAMNYLALLCGCPVLIVPTGERMEPEGFREWFEAECARFPAQLAEFIRITQFLPTPNKICAVIPTRYRPPELAQLLAVLEADGVCVHLMEDPGDHLIYRMWNQGAEAARLHGAEFIAVLNDDITILPGTLPLLAASFVGRPKLGVVYPDQSAPAMRLPTRLSVMHTIGDVSTPRGMLGFCFMFRAGIRVPFDESYHWWYGDNQYERDVRAAGWKVGRVNGVPIVHRPDGSASKDWGHFAPLVTKDRELWERRTGQWHEPPGLPHGSAYSELNQGSSFGYERPR